MGLTGRIAFGLACMAAAGLAFAVGHVWVLVLDTGIVYRLGGFWAALAAWCVPPVLYCAPFYAGFLWHDWHAASVLAMSYLVPGILFMNGLLFILRAPRAALPGGVRVILGKARPL